MPDKKIYLPLTDIENVVPILNKISILAGLSEKQLYSVFKVLKKTGYEENEVIFKQGDSPSHIYIVKSGRVKLYMEAEGTTLELIEFGVGNCFGESSLVGIQPHTASAVAAQKTELIVLSGQALFSLYNSDKEIFGMVILNIARETCRRLSKAANTLLHYVSGEKTR